jgi:hypothetical protein
MEIMLSVVDGIVHTQASDVKRYAVKALIGGEALEVFRR